MTTKIWNSSLSVKIGCYFLFLSICIVIIACILAYYQVTETIDEGAIKHLETVTSLKETNLKNWLDEQIHYTVYLSSLPFLYSEVDILFTSQSYEQQHKSAYSNIVHFFRLLVNQTSNYEEIYLLDQSGTVVLSTTQTSEGASLKTDPIFLKGLSSTYLEKLHHSPFSGRPVISLVTPIFNSQGLRIGLLVTDLSISHMSRIILQYSGLGSTGETYIVNKEHHIISSGSGIGKNASDQQLFSEGIDHALKGEKGYARYLNYNKNPVIGYFIWIDEIDCALISEINQFEAFIPAGRLAITILLYGLLFSCLLTVGTYLLARRITRPILGITDTVIRIMEGDLSLEVPVLTNDELGILSLAFNQMTKKLRISMEGLEQKVTELGTAQEALRETENIYRAIFENNGYAMILIEDDRTITMVNKKMEELVTMRREDIIGKMKWSDYVANEEDLKQMLAYLNQRRFYPDSVPSIYEYQLYTSDGILKDVAIMVMMIPGTSLSIAAQIDITERKKTDSALIEAESKFRGIVEQSLVGISIRCKNRFTYVNHALSEMFGYSPEELYTSKNIFDLVLAENRDHVLEKVQISLEHQTSLHYTFTGVRKNGSLIEIEMYDAPADNLGPETRIGVILDITRRKNAEEALKSAYNELEQIIIARTRDLEAANAALRKERDFSNTLIHSSPTFFMVLDPEAKILLMNPSLLETLHFKEEDIIGKNYISSFVAPMDREMMAFTLRELGEKKGGVISEHRVLSRDGKELLLEWHGTPVMNSDGVLDYFFGVSIDITRKKIAEKALQVNENKYRILFQQSELLNRKFLSHILNMPLGYMEISYDYTITDWNPSAQAIYGYAKQEVFTKKICPLLLRDMPLDFFDPVSVLSAKENRASRRLESYSKDGRELICDWYITPLQDYYNNLSGWAVIFQDRSEMIKTQEELRSAKELAEEANVSKGYFLANVSHEIRTPLNAIIGFSSLLTEVITDPSSIRYLQSINSAGKALLQLINDILDLSKIEAHKLEFVYNYADLNHLCRDVEMILEQRAKEKGILFSLILSGQNYVMLIDENRLRQILLNLVGNAIKFTSEGYVSLSLEVDVNEDGYGDILFRISDSGVGIPKKDQIRIFSPFEQQNPEYNVSFTGTGLGLAICDKLVSEMGGRIDLKSEPGEGSEFTVFIPHVQWLREGLLSRENPVSSQVLIQFEPAAVLIVDDVESNRAVLSDMVTQIGLTPLPVSSALNALIVLNSESPDIILTDLRMPEMSGEEFLLQIRRTYHRPDIPVIAVTALSGPLYDSITCSFNAIVRKPVQIRDLVNVLAMFLVIKGESSISSQVLMNPYEQENLPELTAYQIREQILPQLTQVSQIFSIQKAREIADKIELLAQEEDSKDLFWIASDLRNSADNYDLRRIKEIIRYFNKISSK